MQPLDSAFVQRILDGAPEGIVICDARAGDHPVVYMNAAFEKLTGYTAGELMGSNLRLLQGTDRDQEGRRRISEALARGEECRVLLRNYRKSGELVWSEMYLQPMRDAGGQVTHYVGFFRDASSRLKSAERSIEGLPAWLREDRVTGLSSRAWFDELLEREWLVARREERPLTLALFDLDAMGLYNDTFGKAAGDACLKRVARVIAGAFRRGTDVVARWDGGTIGVLAVHRDGLSVAGVVEHAQATVRKVAEMRVHHPRSPTQKFVTVTASLATVFPQRDEESPARLLERATHALREAKRDLRGGLNQFPD
ncbi:MAG TPA: diguanylate cyclase [Steroidobacteraceae bacterium]|nr:diguanylate cyclase [Steroidobacteraceae bacterium]